MGQWSRERDEAAFVDLVEVGRAQGGRKELYDALERVRGAGRVSNLFKAYGAFPARKAAQAAFFEGLDEKFPQGVDWQVIVDSLSHPDIPSHEANMPNFQEADDRVGAFWTLMGSEGTLDMDAEMNTLVTDLQVIFDKAE